jgi:hypothetical protein
MIDITVLANIEFTASVFSNGGQQKSLLHEEVMCHAHYYNTPKVVTEIKIFVNHIYIVE